MPAREDGAVAIIVALVIAVLFAIGGVALDLGHLFVNKTELQNAADACALAAAGQLTCDPAAQTGCGATGQPACAPCPASFLADAEAAGMFVARRNTSDFQKKAVTIEANDILFHTEIGPNESYLSRAAGANPNSKFVRCVARSAPINAWLMQASAKVDPTTVRAAAVATLAPGQTACNAAPIGICAKAAPAPSYGYTVGEWILGKFNQANTGDALEGNFRWVDFTPNAGGTDELRDQLLGKNAVCDIRVGNDIREEGNKQGAKDAWNTRFGIYPKGGKPSPAEAPPDRTGFAYPSTEAGNVIGIGQSAYASYRTKQDVHAPFNEMQYGGAKVSTGSTATLTSQEHLELGADRRLIAVPLLQCDQSPATVKILSMGCVLMLNPMSNGANGDLYMEWRGLASSPGSPCRSAGVAGGTDGPLVPTLVQ